MTHHVCHILRFALGAALLAMFPTFVRAAEDTGAKLHRFLYVAEPGVRDYLEYGGHGVLVFDIDNNHKFVRRIPTGGTDKASGKPMNVKGVCASAATGRLYVSTIKSLMCLDLATEKLLWEKSYDTGCDRMSITPDGKSIYLPSLEGALWNVVDGGDGHVVETITPRSGAHNTIVSLDGRFAYLAGLKSPVLRVADARTHKLVREVGSFGNVVRPFTVNSAGTLAFVNVNDLLGFEVGDLTSGKVLHRVEVQGYKRGEAKRHGCPSHGIGMTPDEKELWLCDAANQSLHVFDATVMPPKQMQSIKLADEPGWVTFTIDGQYAYPSTGQVIDAKTKKILTQLTDEEGRRVQSEKLLEIDLGAGGKVIRAGDQFGLGRASTTGHARAEAAAAVQAPAAR